jgi:predicted negative regulator of RcsB-dependent stress response
MDPRRVLQSSESAFREAWEALGAERPRRARAFELLGRAFAEDRVELARADCDRALELSAGLPELEGLARLFRAWTLEDEAAIAELRRALSLLDPERDAFAVGTARARLAALRRGRADAEAVRRDLAEARAAYERAGASEAAAAVLLEAGRLELERDRPAEAARCADGALDRLAGGLSADAPSLRTDALDLLGDVARARGERAQARHRYREALANAEPEDRARRRALEQKIASVEVEPGPYR